MVTAESSSETTLKRTERSILKGVRGCSFYVHCVHFVDDIDDSEKDAMQLCMKDLTGFTLLASTSKRQSMFAADNSVMENYYMKRVREFCFSI